MQKNKRQILKSKFKNREKMFAGWISFSHPSITETFAQAGFDFIAIDMEHSTISLEQAQRIIAASQSHGIPCIPRPVSHSNDYIKPILESGADGLLIQMVEDAKDVELLIEDIKFPPIGKRTYGVNRAQGYGFNFKEYAENWNQDSSFLVQIESIKGVQNIDEILSFEEVDGVMIGPYDISGSLGVPGQLDHPMVRAASKKVVEACARHNKSCGTQVNDTDEVSINDVFNQGFTFVVLGSDLFVLWRWAEKMKEIMTTIRVGKKIE